MIINIINRLKKIKLVYILVFIFLCINSMSIFLKLLPNNTYRVESKLNNLTVLTEVTKDSIITQPIKIYDDDVRIKSIYLMLANYENRDNHGKIKFTLSQNNQHSEKIMDVSNITRDNDYYKINFNFDKFSVGKAILTIQGIDTEAGSSIAVYCSSDDNFGYSNVTLDGILQDKSLVQRIEYNVYDKVTNFKYFLLLILMIIVLISVYVIIKYKGKFKSYFLFLLSLAIIIITYTLRYYYMLVDAQPYAEEVTVFYKSAKSLTFFENLFIPDAGYLPLLQHLIAWIFVRILNLGNNSVFFMNFIALIIGGSICALLNSEKLSNYFSCKVRFIISIFLPLILLENFETLTFINFAYYGIILVVFAGLIDLTKLSNLQYFILVMSISILCLSKGFYVVLIPIILLYLIVFARKSDFRRIILSISILLTSSIELLYSLKNQSMWLKETSHQDLFTTLILLIKNVLFLYSRILVGTVGLPIEKFKTLELYFIGSLFLIITLLIPLYLIVCKKNKDIKYIHLVFLNITTLAISAFCVLTLPYLLKLTPLYRNRHEIFMIVTIFFTIAVAVVIVKEYYIKYNLNKYRYWVGFCNGIAIIVCYVAFSNILSSLSFSNESTINYYSSWKEYGKYINKEAYAIPILPNTWMYQDNSTVYYIGCGASQIMGTQSIANLNEDKNLNNIDIKSYSDIINKKIIGVYVNKVDISSNYKIILKDVSGNSVLNMEQVSPKNKVFTGFLFDEPIVNIGSIEFYDNQGNEMFVKPQIYLVTEN